MHFPVLQSQTLTCKEKQAERCREPQQSIFEITPGVSPNQHLNRLVCVSLSEVYLMMLNMKLNVKISVIHFPLKLFES